MSILDMDATRYILKLKSGLSFNKSTIFHKILKSENFELARKNANRILRNLEYMNGLKSLNYCLNNPKWDYTEYPHLATKEFWFKDKKEYITDLNFKEYNSIRPTFILSCELYPLYSDFEDMRNSLQTATAEINRAIDTIEYTAKRVIDFPKDVCDTKSILRRLYDLKCDMEESAVKLEDGLVEAL